MDVCPRLILDAAWLAARVAGLHVRVKESDGKRRPGKEREGTRHQVARRKSEWKCLQKLLLANLDRTVAAF